ncbi:MAG: formate dehydrogenase accessory sulfurtransferase FdhD [bacterium]
MKDHTTVEVTKIRKSGVFSIQDEVIREIPLTIRINGTPCATLMRTPGRERELALGFCFTEGILPDSWREGGLQWEDCNPQGNTIGLQIEHSPAFQPARPLSSPSSLTDSAEIRFMEPEPSGDETEIANRISPSVGTIDCQLRIPLPVLHSIEGQARQKQALFTLTGATHAACIFDHQGNYLFCFEDMARHNALDKAIGHALLAGVELGDKILFLSGRTNYTLICKAARCRIPLVASVSAPTSLAVSLSRRVGITLIGFLRSGEMNIYAGAERIVM